MTFKQWLELEDTGTSTASIANFARPIFAMVRRTVLSPIGIEDEGDDKEKKKKKGKKKDD